MSKIECMTNVMKCNTAKVIAIKTWLEKNHIDYSTNKFGDDENWMLRLLYNVTSEQYEDLVNYLESRDFYVSQARYI